MREGSGENEIGFDGPNFDDEDYEGSGLDWLRKMNSIDFDEDGIPDHLDPDDDNDGIMDVNDRDDDNDGIPDIFYDDDDNKDGIKDVDEFAIIEEDTLKDGSRLVVMGPPDTPTELSVSDVTHNSVHLSWTPGFDGGMEQYFRIKYDRILDRDEIHVDVYPNDTHTGFELEPGTSYEISIKALNKIFESPYSETIITTTLNMGEYSTKEHSASKYAIVIERSLRINTDTNLL